MVFPQNAQTIAGLVALVSVGLFNVGVIVIPKLWDKLGPYFFRLPLTEKRNVARAAFFIVILPIILMGVYTTAGVYDPKNVDAYVFMAIFLITFVLIFALSISGLISLIRGKRKGDARGKIDELPILFVTGCMFLVIGMLSNLVALMGVSAAMLDIQTGIYNVENYNWGRWFMMDAVYFSVSGTFMVGVAYVYERIEGRGPERT